MVPSSKYEAPRTRFLFTGVTPLAELVRWSCEQRKIAYFERQRPLVSSNNADNSAELQVFTPGGSATGIVETLDLLDRRCRTGERIYGETDSERKSNRELLTALLESLWRPTFLKWLHYGVSRNSFLIRIVFQDATPSQAKLIRRRFVTWQRQIEQQYDLKNFDVSAADAKIDAMLTELESRLTHADSPFLAGNQPGCADVIFAAFASPLILPSNCSATYPALNEFPVILRDQVEQYRQRPAGNLAISVYRTARAPRQPALSKPVYGPSFLEQVFNPRTVRFASQLLVKYAPRIQLGNRLIVSNWSHVTEVLDRDNDFLIAPINGARIDAVSGPFILGMDRSPALNQQRERVYSALLDADKKPFVTSIEHESKRLIGEALEAQGRIDVVNGYARLVACRSAVALFGIAGPTEQDLLRVVRAIFHETFLNQEDDPVVKERGIETGEELKDWIKSEQERRLAQNQLGSDVLGRLMEQSPNDNNESRQAFAGLLVGAIDTTATVVANIIAEVLGDAKLKAAMTNDIDDPRRLIGWCWEALRRRPHNSGMLRQAGSGATLGQTAVKEGTQVLLLTVGAMHDPGAFDNPNVLRPDRPLDRYLHFGRGLHQCSGRDFNAVQIPALVRELLRHDVSGPPRVRTRGPFPDELVVSIHKPR